MKIFVALATIAVVFVLAAAAPQNENELASEEAEIQSALEQALIQSALEDEDETNLQNILAEAEQDTNDDDLNRAQVMKLVANMQSPEESEAHIQRRRRRRRRRRWRWRKIWHGTKKVLSWVG